MRYILREAALADLEAIWLYTGNEWNVDQADHYVRALLARCEWLAANPLLGKQRDDIKTGYRCFPEGMHLVFYKQTKTGIDVMGFLHQSMDVVLHLNP
jgi:toxin ParE1/3/4